MREIISKAMSSGLDFTRRGALKSFLNKMDVEEELYDKVYITIKNIAHKNELEGIKKERILIFLPQCLMSSADCEAELTDSGSKCLHCGSCSISEVVKTAEELGYGGVYIVPGGSLVRKIIKDEKPEAVIGVACHYELVEAIEYCTIHSIHVHGIPLLRDGCKDTKMDKEELIKLLGDHT